MSAFSVVIMAGGTGGHVFPALAVAKQLLAEGCTVSWLGTRKGIEATLVPQAGIEIDYLDVTGVRGKGVKTLLVAPFRLLKACTQAWKILQQRAPQLVLGFGGFASGPGGLVAWLRRVPLVIHEQNAVAGTTNRMLACFARKVLLGFDGAINNGIFVGNPVRAELFADTESNVDKSSAAAAVNLLVLGGSLGATAINSLLPEALKQLTQQQDVVVRHQAGAKNIASAEAAYRAAGINKSCYSIEPFIADMAAAYRWADIIICRAGALTVAEVAAAGKAAIFIPYPHAIDDHQTANAMWLANQEAGLVYQQTSLDAEKLAEAIQKLAGNEELRCQMGRNARALAQPDTVQKIVALCRESLS